MIFYLTFNDLPSGIFSSQVIDVVNFLNSELKADVRLVSFISLRKFLTNRRKIKIELPRAIVLPMFPGVHRWRKNGFLFWLIASLNKPDVIIGRSVLATQLALGLKHKGKTRTVVYDGRGAITAEWKEYGVVRNEQMLKQIAELERQAINDSDYRISVSNELLQFWKQEYAYNEMKHVVIPCTLNNVFGDVDLSLEAIRKTRRVLGLNDGDIVFVYAGSIAGWQSFELLYDFIKPVLNSDLNTKLLFLSDLNSDIAKFQAEFHAQVICKNLNPKEVPAYLIAADYGLLIREETVTNLVASPVKFAEYLACGLQVIISNKLGDYSEFVMTNNCGFLFNKPLDIKPIPVDMKVRNSKLALENFTKKSFINEYRKVIAYR